MTFNMLCKLYIDPDKIDYALDYCTKMQKDTMDNEPGIVVFYQWHQQTDEPNVFWTMLVFRDEAAKDWHLERHTYRFPEFEEFITEPPIFYPLTPL